MYEGPPPTSADHHRGCGFWIGYLGSSTLALLVAVMSVQNAIRGYQIMVSTTHIQPWPLAVIALAGGVLVLAGVRLWRPSSAWREAVFWLLLLLLIWGNSMIVLV